MEDKSRLMDITDGLKVHLNSEGWIGSQSTTPRAWCWHPAICPGGSKEVA